MKALTTAAMLMLMTGTALADMRTFMAVVVFALAPPAFGQETPALEQLKGTFECTVLQTAGGDVLHLNCTESASPLAEDWDFEIYRVTKVRYSERISIWLRSNVAMERMYLDVTFRHQNDQTYQDQDYTSSSDIAAGEEWTEAVYPEFTYTHVDIAARPGYGWTCKGCGTYVGTDLPTSNLVDPTSIKPEDVGRFMQEMQSVVMPRR